MNNRKTYTTKEVCAALGKSRQRINQLIHGYNTKGSKIKGILIEDIDFIYQRANILLTTSGFNKIKKYFKS